MHDSRVLKEYANTSARALWNRSVSKLNNIRHFAHLPNVGRRCISAKISLARLLQYFCPQDTHGVKRTMKLRGILLLLRALNVKAKKSHLAKEEAESRVEGGFYLQMMDRTWLPWLITTPFVNTRLMLSLKDFHTLSFRVRFLASLKSDWFQNTV